MCLGTRLQTMRLGEDTITCKVLTGPRRGNTVIIHRVRFTYGDNPNERGVPFQRIQFPVYESTFSDTVT